MMTLNPGMTGAKRQSWEKHNPRELIRDAIRSKPKASEAEIREIVWETVRHERAYLPVIFDYWFTNNYRQFFVEVLGDYSTAVFKKNNNKTRSTPTRREINEAKDEFRTILMDHKLSNGKLLRNATFADCAIESGWLREVAKQGKPAAIVGKHLTEKDLHNLRMRVMRS